MTDELLALTSDIVSAHVSHNNVSTAEVPQLIRSTFEALRTLGEKPAPEAPAQQPAVSIRASVKPDYLVCLEDGEKLTMLKRHLRVKFSMSPQDYRAKWNLPPDYPMVAPNYAERRRALAKSIGLGRKPVGVAATSIASAAQAVGTVVEPIVETVKKGRRKLGIAFDKAPAVEPVARPKAARKPRGPKAG